VGNDSGPLHLAGFQNCKGVVLFGPAAARQWGPLGLSHIQSNVNCSPCTRIGRIQCPHPVCMDSISLQRVQKKILALINEGQKGTEKRKGGKRA
jgi:ADP-heptose:LPS heptosyltransferase